VDGNSVVAAYDTGSGRLTELTRQLSQRYTSGSASTRVPLPQNDWAESYLFTYNGSGQVSQITLRRTDDVTVTTPTWTTIRTANYSYYGADEDYGTDGDLKYVRIKDASGNIVNASYYEYYVNIDDNHDETWNDNDGDGIADGYGGGLRNVFEGPAFARYSAHYAGGSYVGLGADDSVKFVTRRFEYETGSTHRVTAAVVQDTGADSNAGDGTYTYSYATPTSNTGVNQWTNKTTETLPDGNKNIEYSNQYGQCMLDVFQKPNGSTPTNWGTFYRYTDDGRTDFIAQPSAVNLPNAVLSTSNIEQYADLMHDQSGNFDYLAITPAGSTRRSTTRRRPGTSLTCRAAAFKAGKRVRRCNAAIKTPARSKSAASTTKSDWVVHRHRTSLMASPDLLAVTLSQATSPPIAIRRTTPTGTRTATFMITTRTVSAASKCAGCTSIM
jgi:hypothetical protein